MTDIALRWNPATQSADLAIEGGDLAKDDGLMTAVIISLFTDRRARPDDVLPQAGADPRGWWGDFLNDDPNDQIGSRLWLLEREVMTDATALKAKDIVSEALAWLVSDGIARSVEVDVTIVPVTGSNTTGGMAIGVSIVRPDGPTRQRYDFLWDATARSFAAT